jgi:hypothetical protein
MLHCIGSSYEVLQCDIFILLFVAFIEKNMRKISYLK